MMMIEITSRRLLHGLGFSKGCDEFGPKKPPPLVPSCLIATSAATGPTAIDCAPRSSVLRLVRPAKGHRHSRSPPERSRPRLRAEAERA